MSKSTLRTYHRADNIIVLSVEDTSPATVRDWEYVAIETMSQYGEQKQKRIYDLRALRSISVHALRTAIKVKSHPNADLAYVAVLYNHSRVMDMVRMVLSIQPGGRFLLTHDEEKAIAWLNSKVPN